MSETRTRGRKRTARSAIAALGALALAPVVAMVGAQPALADGTNGEVRGYLWPGSVGQNWEGTYRMPDGTEAWCASIWSPEPIHADSYGPEVTLTMNNGAPMSADSMQQLAYVVSEASDRVIAQKGKVADDYAAATSVIVHNLTNSDPSTYNPTWPLDAFAAGKDPLGTGQKPQQVPAMNRPGFGSGIVGQAEFVAEKSSGTAQVLFTVPAGHAGATLVAFERLLDVDGKLVASHEDINDVEQTITVEKKPGSKLPETGAAAGLGFVALGLIGAGATLLMIRRRTA